MPIVSQHMFDVCQDCHKKITIVVVLCSWFCHCHVYNNIWPQPDIIASSFILTFLTLHLTYESAIFCRWLCISVRHVPSNHSSFWFFDGIQPFFGRQFSMWHSTKCCSSIFDLGPLTPKIWHKIAYKLACMAGRPEMFGPTRGFSGMADSMEPYKMWADPCCHGNEILANLRYVCTKSPISRLVCQIDQICLGLPGRPTLVAMTTTFALGAESNRLPACHLSD